MHTNTCAMVQVVANKLRSQSFSSNSRSQSDSMARARFPNMGYSRHCYTLRSAQELHDSSRRESRSQSVLSQPRVISNTFVPVASKACPTCGMQHAQSDLQSTCLANQPLPHAVHACKRRPSAEGYDLLFFCSNLVNRYL